MQVRISDIVAEPHLQFFNSEVLHQIDHGGASSFKSSARSIKIALRMLKDPTCEVVVVRHDYSDHKDTTFAQLKWAFNKLGVKLMSGQHYPEGNDLWIRLPQGNYVHFKHMKEIDKLKGTMPRGVNNAIKIVWYFEITQFKSEWYLNESNARFIRAAKDYMWLLYEYNDPPKSSHWVYDWVEKMKTNPDAYVKKTNYHDAPGWQQKKFLGSIMLKEIERLKEIDFEQFKSTYLAELANLKGAVYKKFDASRHVCDIDRNPNRYIKITAGVDVGETDATVFSATGVLNGWRGIRKLDHYYHKNSDSENEKGIMEYAEDLFKFCERLHVEFDKVIRVKIDQASAYFINYIKKEKVRRQLTSFIIEKTSKKKRTKYGEDQIEERIAIKNIMFGADFYLIDKPLKQLVKAHEECERNDKGGRRDDGTSDIDSLDADEYSWMEDSETILNAIMRGRGYDRKRQVIDGQVIT